MSRSIETIYSEIVTERNKRLELKEFNSDSKMSVMNGISWAVAAVVHTFETILDVFAVDISNAISSRVNGTPQFYANALLKYQKGDELIVREDGLAFMYATVDESKKIITQVAYEESDIENGLDSQLILKVATGTKGDLKAIQAEELEPIKNYINKIKFAGTRLEVVSGKGDVLIPRLTVYYDGAVLPSVIYDNIDASISNYIMNMEFNGNVYVSKVMDAIKNTEHVTDVYINESAIPDQGVFLASYDADGLNLTTNKIERVATPVSGYIRQSLGEGDEELIPSFRNSITLVIENKQ